jgi:hypothetical protein
MARPRKKHVALSAEAQKRLTELSAEFQDRLREIDVSLIPEFAVHLRPPGLEDEFWDYFWNWSDSNGGFGKVWGKAAETATPIPDLRAAPRSAGPG